MTHYNITSGLQELAKEKPHLLLQGLFGIEKESLRVDKEAKLSSNNHPKCFGNKGDHPFITTDFAESQVEMITPPRPSILEAHQFLETIQDVVNENIGDELLWPQSAPCLLPPSNEIKIAHFSADHQEKNDYRNQLAEIYGKERQMISGIHFNFSLSEELIQHLAKKLQTTENITDFSNHLYLKMVRNFMRHRWLLTWLFGMCPITDPAYKVKGINSGKDASINALNAISLRVGPEGYRNKHNYNFDYSSISTYQKAITELVDSGELFSEKELYLPIRLKFTPDSPEDVKYIEIRILDLNPFEKTGVDIEALHFTHLLLIYCLLIEEDNEFTIEEQEKATQLHDLIASKGLQCDLKLDNGNYAYDEAQSILYKMTSMINSFNYPLNQDYLHTLLHIENLSKHPNTRTAHQFLNVIKNEGYINFHLRKAKEYKSDSLDTSYKFHGLEYLELSTQLLLKAAIKKGVNFDIIDPSENFVRLFTPSKEEYVIQATKTSLDNYSSILVMENKIVTKKVLSKESINTPKGKEYHKNFNAQPAFEDFKNKAIVIKPKSTNFGLGINIITYNNSSENFYKAVELAYKYDNSLLIEDFFEGKEYRFFVLDDKVVGILHRVPANVIGDGKHTIRDLVGIKNQDPLRGIGYKTPLEKLRTGEEEVLFLKTQGLDMDYIPKENEQIFLRENSNISTGGDSIDMTDAIHPSYKEIAIKAAKAVNVRITGLDMMIPNIDTPANDGNYCIIEMNFNPAIHIHCHPYQGKNRKLNEKILNSLGF
ncbi:MAG: bifunctional glutamate--cysteine ligase GshA/glutathione synthetase GshB [Hyphomicrobiales bacterium]